MPNQTKMRSRRFVLLGGGAAMLAACTAADQEAILRGVITGSQGGSTSGLTQAEAVAGIKEALNNGVGAAIARVGKENGYFIDRIIHIPLPGFLSQAQSTLSRIGLSGMLDDLERQLNRGAEMAANQAAPVFVDAIRTMTVRDAIGIVRGGPTSATDYFEARTTPALTSLFSPIMTSALQRTGAIQTFDDLVARLSNVPLAPSYGASAKQDLIDHGIEKGLDGIFHYIGQEEAAIRRDPVKRTSEILRKVFG